MSLPVKTKKFNGCIFEWQEEKIVIDVSRLKQHTDGRVTGEIKIQTTDVNFNPHLHQALFNFSASRSRKELAKLLSMDYEGLLNNEQWNVILEQLCVKAIDHVREGEPREHLIIEGAIEPPRYLLEPLIIENYPNVLFGDPSASKSTLAVVICQLLQLPWEIDSLGFLPPAEPVRALYLDWEADSATIKWQTRTLQRGMGIPEDNVYLDYRRCAMPLAQDYEQIHKHIEDIDAQFVVIDSLGQAAGGELKETQSPLQFFAALRQLNVTSLILAHNAKNPDSKTKSIYGNQYFTAAARNIWEVRKSQEVGSSEMSLLLMHQKPAPFHKKQKHIGFKFHFDDTEGSMVIESCNPLGMPEFIEQQGAQARILDLLADMPPLRPKDIAVNLDMSQEHVRQALFQLKKKKKVVKLGDEYGLLFEETVSH